MEPPHHPKSIEPFIVESICSERSALPCPGRSPSLILDSQIFLGPEVLEHGLVLWCSSMLHRLSLRTVLVLHANHFERLQALLGGRFCAKCARLVEGIENMEMQIDR